MSPGIRSGRIIHFIPAGATPDPKSARIKFISRKGESLESFWSGKRGSNPRPSAWKADALPSELFPPLNPKRASWSSRQFICWWGGEDSNLRRLSRQIYSLIPLATREPPPKTVIYPKTTIYKAIKKTSREPSCSPKPPYPSRPEWGKRGRFAPGFPPARSGRRVPPWSWREDSNLRPADYKSAALPAELRQPAKAG